MNVRRTLFTTTKLVTSNRNRGEHGTLSGERRRGTPFQLASPVGSIRVPGSELLLRLLFRRLQVEGLLLALTASRGTDLLRLDEEFVLESGDARRDEILSALRYAITI